MGLFFLLFVLPFTLLVIGAGMAAKAAAAEEHRLQFSPEAITARREAIAKRVCVPCSPDYVPCSPDYIAPHRTHRSGGISRAEANQIANDAATDAVVGYMIGSIIADSW